MPSAKNLLFLLSDNHARGFIGAYGNPLARTPHLDALAARGTLYENAYAASPLCCPSRAALATGRYPHQTGYWDNAIPFDGREESWMRRVRDAGHSVVSIGKLHFRDSRPANGFSEERHAMHILDGRGGVHMLLRAVDREPVNHGQWPLYMTRSGRGSAPYQGFDRKVTAEATQWLREVAPHEEQPFVLFVSYPSAHPPFSVPEPFYRAADELAASLPADWDRPEVAARHPATAHLRRIMNIQPIRDEAALRRVIAGYLALCEHLDNEIGEVLGALDAAGLTGETRVIYTSDHGEMGGALGLFGKACLYERSIGVPLIVAGPEVAAGARVAAPVSHVDLAPTIEDALGVAPPAADDRPGISLFRPDAIVARDAAFAEYHAAGSRTGGFMLREGRWKLLYHVGMPVQLFDLEADPEERHDLGPDHAEAARLEAHLRRICDPEVVDARAKTDQRRWLDHWGGADSVAAEPLLIYTPPPGSAAEME